ncbi:MAG TPA: DUF3618 domain-containing protein [Phycisphaerae bacterium]|nr:DUF3618 domain-containing protein [Phycisphaerae bacterium]HOJ73372.1 DUF3618 domain-containing protein [Phycisphaerae bacterium]HOM50981.1 DUF3618 domain-containing protein [Phycisphaerae bacterium]HON66438.1 DUF3618 domain-containing protein [Phycisphaerae bacterium]HOQ86406.1 DUF3618 domain-containing protein [Phycisphaerae bacterium]
MGKTQVQPTASRDLTSEDIKREIEQTRAEIDTTVDQLSERLQLQHLMDRLLGTFQSSESGVKAGDVARQAGKWAATHIARYPLPIAVIGAGTAWLAMQIKRQHAEPREPELNEPETLSGAYEMPSEPGFEKTTSPGLRDEMNPARDFGSMSEEAGFSAEPGCAPSSSQGRLEKTKQRISEISSRAKHRASETAEKVSEWSKEKLHRFKGERSREAVGEQAESMRRRVRDSMDRVRMKMDRGRGRVGEIFNDYPLAIGVSALALGLIIGLSLPATRRERRTVGAKASRWREQMKERAGQLIERGKEAAQHTAEAVKEEARRQGLTAEGIKESVKQVAREAGSAVEREGLSPEGLGGKVDAIAQQATETLQQEVKPEQGRQEDRI